MSNALVVRTEMDVMTLGKVLVESHFFSDSTQAAQAVVKVLAGHELGFGPIASMTGINIIKGRVTLSANLLAAAIKRSGKYNYIVKHLDDQACVLEFTENGKSVGESSFTMEDAQRAQLDKGDNWRKFPRNMLFARAVSNGAKIFSPDIFGGPVYTPDELGATIDGETGDVIEGETIEPEPAQNAVPVLNGNGNGDRSHWSTPGTDTRANFERALNYNNITPATAKVALGAEDDSVALDALLLQVNSVGEAIAAVLTYVKEREGAPV